ncbi:sulfotransferase family protein [Dapis sp. BLCC M229]|uniref:sulfotransferase family protein n=1 Tax=Dapis sp. BLCC M229 TaxID=3400188 RepID=UPI003CF28652
MSRSEKEFSRITEIKMELTKWQEKIKEIKLALNQSYSSVNIRWKYLFVCGCPRSGTTAILNLLNYHPLIALGVERYKHYANKTLIHKLNPDLFQPSVFFDVREEQTNLNPQHKGWENQWKPFYEELKEKFPKNTTIIGDKFPHYYEFYEEINAQFTSAGVKFIFMLRDIIDVALSYDARAKNQKDIGWGRNRNYKFAVSDWNQSLINTWNYLENRKQENLFICEYEKLFSGDDRYLNLLLNFLDINSEREFFAYYKSMTQNWKKYKQREKVIDQEELTYIEQNSNYVLRDKILQKYAPQA